MWASKRVIPTPIKSIRLMVRLPPGSAAMPAWITLENMIYGSTEMRDFKVGDRFVKTHPYDDWRSCGGVVSCIDSDGLLTLKFDPPTCHPAFLPKWALSCGTK